MTVIYNDRVVVITGAASGFGALAADMFAKASARLALSDMKAPEELVAQLRDAGAEVVVGCVDVTDENQIRAHLETIQATYGRLDVAINNAGIGHDMRHLEALSGEDFDRVMTVNAKGVFLCMKPQYTTFGVFESVGL